MKNFIYILILFLFSISEAVYSQSFVSNSDTLSTEEIVVTANRIKMTSLISPNKILVLDNSFLVSLNGNKLSDVLDFSDGVFVKDYGFNSGLKTLSLNSTQSEHTLILLNGVKLNSRQNAQFDLGLIQTDEISRVEISKGGASSLYGTEAIGGIVNIITKRENNKKPFGLEINSSLGSFGFKRIFVKGMSRLETGKSSNTNISFSYSNESARNNYDYNFFDGLNIIRKERGNSDYKRNSINVNLDYRHDQSSAISFFTFYNYMDRGVPSPDAGISVSMGRQIDRDLLSTVNFNKSFYGSNELNVLFSYKYSLINFFDPKAAWLSEPLNSFYKLTSYIGTAEFKHEYFKSNEIDFGYDLSYNTISSNETEPGKSLQAALFAAGKMEFSGKVLSSIIVYPSIRYDYYSNIERKNVPTGKMGLNVKPFKNIDLSLKSSFGNNFAAPTFNELYWKELGNKNLLPERSVCFDAGVYYSFNLLAENQLEVSYFNINTTDRIVWTPDEYGVWRPVNIGKVKSEGIDISLKSSLKLSKSFNTEFSFNYNYGVALKKNEDFEGDVTFDKQLIYIPQEYAKSIFTFGFNPESELLKLFSLNFFYTFTGKRFIDQENTKFVPYYELIDANVFSTLNAFNTEIFIKFIVNNITNKDYQVVPGYPMPLRNYKFQIGIKY
jgi:outer membrane cobalamin receptor